MSSVIGEFMFEKGDKVQLRTGGLIMTVRRVGNFSPIAADGVECMWFGYRHKKYSAIFEAEALEKVL